MAVTQQQFDVRAAADFAVAARGAGAGVGEIHTANRAALTQRADAVAGAVLHAVNKQLRRRAAELMAADGEMEGVFVGGLRTTE